jgi:ribonuclease H / adenosylcobalamin/alpha-ribazole phosphatase
VTSGPTEPAGPGTTAPSTGRGSVRSPRAPGVGAPTTLLVIRHGRTVLTEAGRFSGGGGADPPLSPAGEQDAARVAAVIAGLGRPGALFADLPPVTAVITSPMLRTRQTAGAVAEALGLGEPVAHSEWIEAGFGAWDGLTYADLVRDHAEELRRWQGSTSYAPPGGESLDEVRARVREARAAAVAVHRGQAVAVVTHASPVRVVLQEAADAGPSALWRLRVSAGSLSIVRYWDDGGIELVTANATAHLAQPTPPPGPGL